jgi:hypothetical protein
MPDSRPAGEAWASELDQLLEVYALSVVVSGPLPGAFARRPCAANTAPNCIKPPAKQRKKAASGKPEAAFEYC